jgi:dihydroflavonol-4-reductase
LTGATGFIGGALAERLRERRVEVRALVRRGSRTGRLAAVGVQTIAGDLAGDLSGLSDALHGVDTVFHVGALLGPPYLPRDRFFAVNRDGTQRLVDACATRVARFVHVSTVAVVGSIPPGVEATEDHPCRPLGHYGESKRAAELVVEKAARQGLPAVIVRPMWIYGPESRAANRLLDWIARGRFFLVGSATNTIQPLALDDLLDGLVKCATVPGIEGRTYHLAGAEVVRTAQFCEQAALALGVRLPRWRVPLPIARGASYIMERTLVPIGIRPPLDANKIAFFEVNHAYSIARAARDLGWIPTTTWREGLGGMVAARRRH